MKLCRLVCALTLTALALPSSAQSITLDWSLTGAAGVGGLTTFIQQPGSGTDLVLTNGIRSPLQFIGNLFTFYNGPFPNDGIDSTDLIRTLSLAIDGVAIDSISISQRSFSHRLRSRDGLKGVQIINAGWAPAYTIPLGPTGTLVFERGIPSPSPLPLDPGDYPDRFAPITAFFTYFAPASASAPEPATGFLLLLASPLLRHLRKRRL